MSYRQTGVALGTAVAAILLTLGGCGDEPEPSGYSMTLSSLGDASTCAVGGDAPGELCFPAGLLDLPTDTEAHLDDCVRVELTEPGGTQVDHAVWDGRCSTRPVTLGLETGPGGGSPTILVPECLGSLTSLTVADDAGGRVWSVARQVSPEHPLIARVLLGEAPPGFAVNHELGDGLPPPGTELVATATQQLDLPAATVTFTVGEQQDTEAAGCRRG